MELFGIGWMEMIVIGLVALIVVGPKRLPQAAQTIGRLFGYATQQWRNIQSEVRRPMENEFIDIKNEFESSIHDIKDITDITDIDLLIETTPDKTSKKK